MRTHYQYDSCRNNNNKRKNKNVFASISFSRIMLANYANFLITITVEIFRANVHNLTKCV